ncbi:YciI family protein [Amycolatopsis sp. lyj-112]|uniref:YciI family protein n=1 Tax=Amycolatopsis sp. lyj-112 TaxID=2789288 RepID=UPI00397814A8
MKYMIMITMNPAAWDAVGEDERNEVMARIDPFMQKLTESGELLGTQALGEPKESTVVRVRDGVPVVTDGPFAESKEFLAGYYLVECDSKERAIEIAGLVPDAHINAMEVRPVVFSSGVES